MRKDWKVKKLGDVATYINGYAFKPNQWSDTGIPIIRIQNLNDDDAQYNYCNNDNIPSKYLVNKGDILISWSASLGVYEWLKNTAYLNQHIFKVVFDKLEISKYYFKYAVSSKIDHMVRNAHGATMKHIVKKDFDNTKIYYPPLQTQQQIVEELDCLTSIIEKQKKQLEELDNLTQAIFYDMFGDPIENEKGWETSTIDNVCSSIIRGPFGSALKKEFFVEKDDSTYKVYEQKNAINKNAFIGEYYISKEMYKSLSRFEVFPNDIIMSCSGTIGELFVIPNEAERGIINQALLKFTLNKKIEQDYFLFMMDLMKAKLDVKGCGIQNIGSVKYIKTTTFGLPPLSLQQKFASKIEAIEKQKELIKKSIKETEDLFNSRMDYYFN